MLTLYCVCCVRRLIDTTSVVSMGSLGMAVDSAFGMPSLPPSSSFDRSFHTFSWLQSIAVEANTDDFQKVVLESKVPVIVDFYAEFERVCVYIDCVCVCV